MAYASPGSADVQEVDSRAFVSCRRKFKMATSDAAVLDIHPDNHNDAESALQFQDFGVNTTGTLSRSGSLVKNEQLHTFTHFPDTPGSDEDDTENLLKDDTAPSDGKSQSFWSLGYYQSFFDVDTNQVLRRILWSMIPNPKAIFLNAHIRPNPDLYGPFWVCATLIFSVAISGNIASYLQYAYVGNYVWKYDFHKVSIAATVVYSYTSLVPLGLWVLLWYRKSEARYTLLEVVCIYGYSLSIYVPLSVLWTVPNDFLRWALVLVGAIASGSVLLLTMWPAFKDDQKKISLIAMALIIMLHLLVAVGFVMYFFRFPTAVTNPHLTTRLLNDIKITTLVPGTNHT